MAGATTSNVYITPTIITYEAITQFKNLSVLANKVDRQHDKEFKKIGNTVNVRKPVMYTSVSNNLDISSALLDTEEASVALTLDQTRTVPLAFDQDDLTLNVEEFSERYIRPAVIELVQQVELSIAGLYTQIYNFIGTPGTTPSTLQHVADVKAQLTRNATPFDMRHAVYEATAGGTIAAAIPYTAGTSVPDSFSGQSLREATVGRFAGFDIHESEAITRHTNGTHTTGSTPLVNDGAPAADSYPTGTGQAWTTTVVTNGWAASTAVLKAGDIITIAGVNSVNPKTYQDTGLLQRFTVINDVTSVGAAATLTISPPLITSGPYQTVTAIYADNAAITVKTGTEDTAYPQNLAFHKKAITLAMAPLQPPDNTLSSSESMDGISISYVRDGDVLKYRTIHRLDILYGVLLQIPQYACRHTG